ncbi:hypothetical protein H4Q26_016554 [Puccinia striiformis f. sp. tritici PST-130]|nr:hypothetical protein H4Q26_016554 [Puccinia striiformis f. sp. tritici PST-130]
MSSQPPPHLDTDDQAQRQLIAERVLKRVRLSKAKRALQTRLRLAGFKASHGWQDVPSKRSNHNYWNTEAKTSRIFSNAYPAAVESVISTL